MAHPVVEGVAESSVNTAGTSHAITLPASIASTDLVLILMNIGSTAATLNALTDWTESLDENNAGGLKIIRYTGTGVPSNPTFTSSANTRSASIAYRISGADKTVAPIIGTTATGTSATPDPPQVGVGGVSNDYLFIAFAGMAGEEADDDTWANTPPSNYTPSPPRQKSCGTAGTNLGGLIMSAERQLTTGSVQNPGTFGVDVSALWRAQHITITPLASADIRANGWRVRNDDGSETTATWMAALNTNPPPPRLDTNFRVRFRVGDIANVAGTFTTPQLQYNKNSAGWNNVTGSSSVVRSFPSARFADNDNTTEQLSGGDAGTFAAGEMDDASGVTTSISLNADGNTEVEYCVQIRSADVVAGDRIELRVVNNGVAMTETNGHPTIGVQWLVNARHQANSATSLVQNLASDSQTPTPDSLLIVASAAQAGNHTTVQAIQTPTGGGWTYDHIVTSTEVDFAATTNFDMKGSLWKAQVGGSPSAHTVTVDHWSGTETGCYCVVTIDILGHDVDDPIVQSAVNQEEVNPSSSVRSGTVTLGSTPEVGNLVVAAFMVGADSSGAAAAPTIGGQAMVQRFSQSNTFTHAGIWYRVIDGSESNNVITCSDLGEVVGQYAAMAVEVRVAPPRIQFIERQTDGRNDGQHTFTLGAGVAVDDTVLLIQMDNWYGLSNLITPTGTAVTTWTEQTANGLPLDGGTNDSHARVWTGVVTTAGGTVIANRTLSDDEGYAAIHVFRNAEFDTADGTETDATSTSHVAPSLTPESGKLDDYLVCAWGNVGTLTNYTVPVGMDAHTERDVGGINTYQAAYEQLASDSATGTRTATSSASSAWNAVSVLMKSPSESTPVNISDTITVGITDALTYEVQLARTDTLTVGITDTMALEKQMPISDTIAVGITDSMALEKQMPISDTVAVGITDAMAVSVSIPASDTAAVGITDTIAIQTQTAQTDSISVGITDSIALEKQIALTDTLAVGLTDAIVAEGQLALTDTLSVGLTESISIAADTAASDTLSVGITDSMTIENSFALEDTIAVGLTDALSVGAPSGSIVVRSPGVSEETANTATHDIVLPASYQAGDVLVLEISCDGAPTVTAPAFWGTAIDAEPNGTVHFSTYYIAIADGNEDNSLTWSSGADNEQSRTVVRAYGNVDTGASPYYVASQIAEGNSANPDPPQVVASWGADDNNLVAVAISWDAQVTMSTPPTNYDANDTSYIATNSGGASLWISHREVSGTDTENPGTGTLSASEQWNSWTYVLKPAQGEAPEPIDVSDTLAVGITDSMSVSVAQPLSDSISVGLTESIAIEVQTTSTDTLSVGITDSIALEKQIALTDTLTTGLTESISINVSVSVSDTLNVGLTESLLIDSARAVSDSISVGLTESIAIEVQTALTDTLSVGVTDSIAITNGFSLSDSLGVSLGEAIAIETQTAQTDTLIVGLTDTMALEKQIALSDTLTINLVDSMDNGQGEQVPKELDDTLTVGITDTLTYVVTIDISDTLAVGLTDTIANNLSSSLTETLSLAIGENIAVQVAVNPTDTLAVGLTESVSIAGALSASDTLAVGLTDSIAINQPTNVSDTLSVGLTESISIAGSMALADTLAVGLTDSIALEKQIALTDTLAVGLTDTIHIEKQIPLSDTLAVGLTDSMSALPTVAVSDTLAVGLTDSISIEQITWVDKDLNDSISVGLTELLEIDTSQVKRWTGTEFKGGGSFKRFNGTIFVEGGTMRRYAGNGNWVPPV